MDTEFVRLAKLVRILNFEFDFPSVTNSVPLKIKKLWDKMVSLKLRRYIVVGDSSWNKIWRLDKIKLTVWKLQLRKQKLCNFFKTHELVYFTRKLWTNSRLQFGLNADCVVALKKIQSKFCFILRGSFSLLIKTILTGIEFMGSLDITLF